MYYSKYFRTFNKQDRKYRFLVGRLLRVLKLNKFFRIKTDNYILQFSPTTLATNKWINNFKLSDEVFIEEYLKHGDIMVDIGANIERILY